MRQQTWKQIVWGWGLMVLVLAGWTGAVHAQAFKPNYEEEQVPEYTLPDPLKFEDGSPVDTPEKWREVRRPQIFELFAEHVYGRVPPTQPEVRFQVTKEVQDYMDGKATLKEIEIHVGPKEKPVVLTLLLVTPNVDHPVPAFLGLNFPGNHATLDDPIVTLNPNWMRPSYKGVVNNRATEESRGINAARWPFSLLIERGYALGTIYCGDIDPDYDDGFQNGIHPLFYRDGQTQPEKNEWGTIGAWAWGLSRGLDYLEQDEQVDGKRVAVIGHSRLGKTSLWAGASDERFALVISNNSGCGGAALSRRAFGETVQRINTSFPHWFCKNFHAYDRREHELPVDQHQLIALIAPRPVYVGSAEQDRWADPKGEFLSAYHADPVYRLLGTDGLGGEEADKNMPAVDEPRNQGTIGYHIRSGGHNVLEYDWLQYLDFADRHFGITP